MDVLNKLGIPPDVQAYFDLPAGKFRYGNEWEYLNDSGHRVPTTDHLFRIGNGVIFETVICCSVLEAAAYLTLNRHRYFSFDQLNFIAIGNLPSPVQLKWLSRNLPAKKVTLVFSDDLLGRLCDIKVAAGLKGQGMIMKLSQPEVRLTFKGRNYLIEPDKLSLNAFEKMSGLRSGCRTSKPKRHNTYLEQLKSYDDQ